MKQLKINRILMDVDGTMTWYLKNPQKSKSMMQCLNEMVQKKYYIDGKCAADKEDTIVFLEMMKKAGIPVCTATTNSVFATLVKNGSRRFGGCKRKSVYFSVSSGK